MWLIIHIPKTAGTSLRWALEKQFGKSQVIWDYGPASKDTSDLVREHLYGALPSSGPAEVVKGMSAKGAKVLIGHVPLLKYRDHFEPGNIISFVRNPLVRMCSEYLHRTKNATFDGSFIDFLRYPGFSNLQSWFLDGSSEKNMICITEQYGDSLDHLNACFHWNLTVRKKNVAWFKGGQRYAETLADEDLKVFNELNASDVNLYLNAKQNFEACNRLRHEQNT